MAQQKVMRDLGLNDMIQVEAPVYLWLAIIAAYNDCDWNNGNFNNILGQVQEKIMDPIWLNEQQAAAQQAHDDAQRMFSQIPGFPGQTPQEGLGDDQL